MLKVLLTLPLVAIAATALSPDVLLQAAHDVANAMVVVTPATFVAGAGLQLLRRSDV